MTSGTTWKGAEAFVASRWFGSKRNILSGQNNRNDDGSARLGDVVYKPAIVEIKVRASNAVIARAKETQELAEKNGLPWVHIERQKGDAKLWALVCELDLMDVAMAAVRAEIERRAGENH